MLFSAYQVISRHHFLMRLITVKDEEVTSYENMHACVTWVTVCICIFSVLEVLSFFLYYLKVWISNVGCQIVFFLLLSFIHGCPYYKTVL